MSEDTDARDDVTAYNKKHVAPSAKRRKLIFDSFSKLKHGTSSRTTKDGGPKGGSVLYSWGAGYHGQLGIETKRKKCEMIPVQINFNLEAVVQIACGGFHTAIVTERGKVYTWGDGKKGQLGNLEAKFNMHTTPHIVDRLFNKTVLDIACGQFHTICVTDKGDLYSWGSGKYGQIGKKTQTRCRWPGMVPKSEGIGYYAKVCCGDRHTVCITTSHKVVTFGSGQHGQLGNGEEKDDKDSASSGSHQSTPRLVKDMEKYDVQWVAAGSTVTACVTMEGHMWLWGFGESIHPKGMPNIVYRPRRIDFFVEQGEIVTQVGIGQSHIVVLTEKGDIWAFGNLYIKRSVSASEAAVANVRKPRLILKGENVKEIACGRYHSMAVTEMGCLYSWGIGESGQLGHNTLQSNEFPTLVDWILPNVVGRIACGDHHSFCMSSIRFHDIHPDIKKWRRLQEKLLKEKYLRRKNKNLQGLKTKQILEIEKRRAILEEQDKTEMDNTRAHQKQLLTVQLELIKMRGQIEAEVQHQQNSKKRGKTRQSAQSDDDQMHRMGANKSKVKKATTKKKFTHQVMTGRSQTSDKADLEDDLAYQPLMPRIGFMEVTQKTLMDIKKQTEALKTSGLSAVKPNVKEFLRELFDQKKEYNKLCEENKRLEVQHQKINKELSFMVPTPEYTAQKRRNKKILDDLKMKLVTKDTQLMETVENKTNYDLYIIRMKEENLVISKSIDNLRQMVREYARLITKLQSVQKRVSKQKDTLKEEISNFKKDLNKFKAFSTNQIGRYRQMINSVAKAKKVQRQSQEEREAKMNNRKKKRMTKLILEHEKKRKEAIQIESDKVKMEKEVEYYEQRFRKITEATGLNQPKDIIDKFFSNDKIAEDLMTEITSKKNFSKELDLEKQSVLKEINERQSTFHLSKWRDVTKQETEMSGDSKRVKKLATELERINNKMLVVKEGINSLLAGVQIATGEDEEYEDDLQKALDTLRSKITRAWEVAKPQMQVSAKRKAELSAE